MEGEAILVGDIPKMDIPSKYFSSGNIAQSSGKGVEECCLPDISFLIRGGFFPPLIKIKRVLVLSILFSLKSLEEYLFQSREFAQTMGNISTTFQLVTIEKDAKKKTCKR